MASNSGRGRGRAIQIVSNGVVSWCRASPGVARVLVSRVSWCPACPGVVSWCRACPGVALCRCLGLTVAVKSPHWLPWRLDQTSFHWRDLQRIQTELCHCLGLAAIENSPHWWPQKLDQTSFHCREGKRGRGSGGGGGSMVGTSMVGTSVVGTSMVGTSMVGMSVMLCGWWSVFVCLGLGSDPLGAGSSGRDPPAPQRRHRSHRP